MANNLNNPINPTALAAAVKAALAKQKTYNKYDLVAKMAEREEAKDAYIQAEAVYRELTDDINNYLKLGGQPPLADETTTMPTKDLITKLEEVMPDFTAGANGKEIAAKVGLGVTSNDISALYWTDKQTTLKKAKDASGNVLMGLKTRYLLAVEDDLNEINADKEQEKKKREAQKAKSRGTAQQSAVSGK